MKRVKLLAMSAVAILAVGVSLASAQREQTAAADMYLISAKAGGVNFVQGSVTVSRADGTGGLLLRGDKLNTAERVETGSGSRAEILLNPGSFLRLGDNSAFEFKNTSLDDLRISLESGSAIFEVYATNEFKISVFTPQSRVTIIDSGVYRVDLKRDGTGVLSVVEGQAVVGEENVAIVREGYTGTLSNGLSSIAKFDRDRRDDLAEWSRSRSKDLTKMASKLKNGNVTNSLISSFNRGIWGNGRTFGLWVYDPFLGACFLPFYSGWRNPYGYGYNSYIYYTPAYINPPVNQNYIRLDGRREPPIDSEYNSKGARSSPSYSPPPSTSSPGYTGAREPSYSPPPPPPPASPMGAKDRPNN